MAINIANDSILTTIDPHLPQWLDEAENLVSGSLTGMKDFKIRSATINLRFEALETLARMDAISGGV